ncbi:hypothetical protein H9Y05_02305 [Crocinitomicaceae bacterium CZZ-1]|uniref:Lipoprotein n=1 Tax=Taishania pollutisoli TaxID=2766479 RepID=A0A8J6PN49_9FLAO|nr:hypothetical protein [Taishania pollutisoli]MBC9811298.1 hypothetical protein [Taishania pollutisoli]
MKRYIQQILFIGAILVFAGCKKDDFQPEESFVKIYNDSEGNKKYVPLGIQQTTDQGYIVLSAYGGWNIHVMKTDKVGGVVWRKTLPSNYVNATNLIKHGGSYYFVCMDNVGLFTYLLQLDEASGNVNEIQNFSGIIYPTYAYSNGTTMYIQNYDRLSYKTGIHQLDPSLTSITQSEELNIMTSVEDRIVDHITHDGKRIPFFVSSTPENDYIVMSCFYNYSFSLVFMNANLQFSGVYNGANFNGGVNAILPKGNSQYAVARFSYDNQYFNANASLNPASVDIAESISASGYSELNPEKPVVIRSMAIGGVYYVVMAGSTRSNQLLLSFFDPYSGALRGTKYVGQNTPYSICDFTKTEDGGLMLLVQAKVMGSYDRIATVKLSDEQLAELLE